MQPSLYARWFAILIALLVFGTGTACAAPVAAPDQTSKGDDGVQRVNIVGGSYFFRPDHIVVQAGQPLAIAVNVAPGMVPHSFVLEAADGTALVDVQLTEEAKILHFDLPPGNYVFYCAKRLLGFKSHRERGMAGVLEVRE